MASTKFKIFAFEGGDTTWIAAEDKDSAIECYEEKLDEYDEKEEPISEVSESDMLQHFIHLPMGAVNFKVYVASQLMLGVEKLPFLVTGTWID